MTAPQLIREIESRGGSLRLNGAFIRVELTAEAKALIPELRKIRDEVYRALEERDHPEVCPVHGAGATWWHRADGSAVCARCHPGSFTETARGTPQGGPPPMPAGVRILRWSPKQLPIEINMVSVVLDPLRFIETTLQQLEAALRGDFRAAGNRSVRDLCERLEQVGVKVDVSAHPGCSGREMATQ
jgi:hypothetical protein